MISSILLTWNSWSLYFWYSSLYNSRSFAVNWTISFLFNINKAVGTYNINNNSGSVARSELIYFQAFFCLSVFIVLIINNQDSQSVGVLRMIALMEVVVAMVMIMVFIVIVCCGWTVCDRMVWICFSDFFGGKTVCDRAIWVKFFSRRFFALLNFYRISRCMVF